MTKTTFIVLTLFLLACSSSIAQSLQLLDNNGNIIEGSTHYQYLTSLSSQQTRFQIKNLTAATQSFALKVSLEYAPYPNSALAIILASNGYIASPLINTDQIINNGIGDTITNNGIYPNLNNLFSSFRFEPVTWMWNDCPNDSAIWHITVYAPNNTADTSSVRVIWKCVTPTGVEDVLKESFFNAHPNPTSSVLNFNSKTTGRLYNVLGSQVLHFNKQLKIDISHLTKGLYFLKTKETTIKVIKE